MRQTIQEATIMVYIDIATFSDGLHEIVLKPTAEELDLDPEKFSSIETMVHLDISDRQILCRIHADVDAQVICDRTLESFVERFGGDHTVVYTRDPDEVGEDDDEIVLLDAGSSRIDITEFVRDTILLSIPLRNVAPHAREAEIPTRFGVPADDGDNIDPRWEALRKLKTGS
jgi:uncharacterized protein